MDDNDPSNRKAFGSLLRKEAREVAIFAASNLLNKAGAFLLLPFYWRRLDPADYGILALIGIVGMFQVLLGTLSLDISVTRFFYEWKEEDRRSNLGAIWAWSWLGIAACTGLFLAAWPWINPLVFPKVPYYPFIFLGILYNALSNLFLIPAATIRIIRLPWLFAAYNFAGFALSSGLGILYVLVLDKGLWGYLVAGIWSNLAMAAFGAAVMLRHSRPCLRAPGIREALRFSLPTLSSTALNTVGQVLDRLLLNWFTNTATLGIYAVSMRFVEVINTVHASMKMAYGPFLMKTVAEDKEHGKENVGKITPFYMFVYCVTGLLISVFTSDFVHLVGQPEYFPVVGWVPLLVGVSILNVLYIYYTPGIMLAKRTDLLWIPSLANLMVLVVSALVFIPKFQLSGLVATRYLSAGAFFLANLYLSQRVFPFPHRWGRLVALILLTAAFSTLGLSFDGLQPVARLAAKIAVSTVFVGLCMLVVLRARLKDLLSFRSLLGNR